MCRLRCCLSQHLNIREIHRLHSCHPTRFSYDFKRASHIMIVQLETSGFKFLQNFTSQIKKNLHGVDALKDHLLEFEHQNEPYKVKYLTLCYYRLIPTNIKSGFNARKHMIIWTFWMNFKVILTINVKERKLVRGNIVIINWSHPKKDRLYSLTFF